ncbi:hypothetical protein [Zhaonella formicivorans]|jgi:hypothetical protein|uniref:hypothetical protein n=1 Tax=Zhaonella formicivorans TaxID=2528593 RepID=UPI0010EBDE23|nr:hypothetical protein [Zhaonella formicivorans]
MPSKTLDRVMDALDLETFLVCSNAEEGKNLILSLMQELGFQDVDVVFIQHEGPGVRVRARAYVHRSGDKYGWLGVDDHVKEVNHG